MMEPRYSTELRLEHVSRRFDQVLALDDADLYVPGGSLVSLLGPSGCGKTTALRIIAGFERPDRGRVLIGDKDVGHLPPNKRNLGMMFQNYSLFPHMTVSENVGFGLWMSKTSKAETGRRVSEILALIRLSGFSDRYPRQLSGGQQQRVALARSIVTNPSVLLLDEPLGALDKNLRESMQFELRQIQQSLGITTIIVTHDQEEAMTLSDQVAVMDAGRILQVGRPVDVYEHPCCRFVSEFLGTANLFKGEVSTGELGEPGIRCTADGASFFVRTTDLRIPPRGSATAIAVRPEKMILRKSRPDIANVMSVEVTGHAFRGVYHAYEALAPGHDAPLIVYQQSGSSSEQVFGVGDKVFLAFAAHDAVYLTDDA